MSTQTVALQRALGWHDALMDHEHRGRRDKESAARGRLADKTGVPESYLYRLAHKRRDMRDIAGEVYRLLEQGHRKYVLACERHEQAADAYRAERLALRKHQNAVDQSPASAGVGMAAPSAGAANAEE